MSTESGYAKTRFDRSRVQFTAWQPQTSNQGKSYTLYPSILIYVITLESMIDLVSVGSRVEE
jgi:hypothetical protein